MNEYYVYEWFIKDTNHIFHVGKGKNNRMFSLHGRNKYFMRIYEKYDCDVRIYKNNLTENDAWLLEKERIKELKNINQAETNLHEGGCGGNTFKYLNENDLKDIKDKIGKTSKEHWNNKEYRSKTTNSIQNSMKKYDIRKKISINTKKAMQNEDIRKSMLYNGISYPVLLVYKNGEYYIFETVTEYFKFLKDKHNVSSRICRNIFNNEFIQKRSMINCKNISLLIGAKAYKLNNDILSSVTTMADECKPVNQILSLVEVQSNFNKIEEIV